MLRHYKVSQEGPLQTVKDVFFGKTPIHLTEEHYNKWLYILYVYTKFFTSSIPNEFSKLIIDSIDILSKDDFKVANEYNDASTETLTEVKKTWLYKNILTKSNKTWVDIQKKILAMYKSLGIEFKGLNPKDGGVWFPYIGKNLNYVDNTRSENSSFLVEEGRGWYSPLYMPVVYGTDDCTNCVVKEGQSDSEEPIYTAAYPFPILQNTAITLCDNKGRHDERVTINPDKFNPAHMFSFIKSNLNNLSKFQKAYEVIKHDDGDIGTLEKQGFFYVKKLISESKSPFYLDKYSSCLAGFVDDPTYKSAFVTWKDNIETGLKLIEYKYLKDK